MTKLILSAAAGFLLATGLHLHGCDGNAPCGKDFVAVDCATFPSGEWHLSPSRAPIPALSCC
jgi:hypothetical protein